VLPINSSLPAIFDAFRSAQNVVLQAEPGAGKSTSLPLSLLDEDWLKGKKIIMLEPRRVAAKSIAHYLANQLGEKVGQRIGYQIKNDRKVSEDTILEVVTEGILTRRLQSDPEIGDVGLIIFDEFHLRSLNSDLALLLTLEIQQTIRDDLKLLVMSATIDTKMVANYLGEAVIIECPGRTYPVETIYQTSNSERLTDKILRALRSVHVQSTSGDLLVFLPGQADINRCIGLAKEEPDFKDYILLPLYGGLPLEQQEQALVPNSQGQRRIVFTTNIAETSLTIEGVTIVIDSGLEKELRYDPSCGMTRLETVHISKSSAQQRAGRAGRTQSGTCIRLWSEEKHRSLKEFQPEEIVSADLSSLLLELHKWGSHKFEEINWLTPPPKAHFDSALAILETLGMVKDSNLTALGEQAVRIGLPPRLSSLLLQANSAVEQFIACDLAALLADRDIFHLHNGVDLTDRLLAIQDYKKNRKQALSNYPLKRTAIEQLLVNASSYRRLLELDKVEGKYELSDIQSLVGKLLLCAYPDRLASKRSNSGGRYQLANGRGAFLFDDDPLCREDWLVVADCDAQKKEGRIFSAATISYDVLMSSLQDKIYREEKFAFEKGKQKIKGYKFLKYGALELERTVLNEIPPEKFQTCLRQVLADSGLNLLNWTDRCEELISRVQWLGEHMNDFPSITKAGLVSNMEQWLLPYLSGVNSIVQLKKVDIYDLLLGMLSWDEQQTLDKEAPTHYKTPSGKSVSLSYNSQQGPLVSVQLQEMFGQVDSPMIGGGKIPIRFELLSPARRPIQTTSDLGNFWRSSYFDVAKEMRGKYPKHRWPEEPLLAEAGKSIKSKKR